MLALVLNYPLKSDVDGVLGWSLRIEKIEKTKDCTRVSLELYQIPGPHTCTSCGKVENMNNKCSFVMMHCIL